MLGGDIWSVNALQGVIKVPGYHITGLNFIFINTGIEIVTVSWDSLRVKFVGLSKVHLECVNFSTKINERTVVENVVYPKGGSSPLKPSQFACQPPFLVKLRSFRLPWWSSWLPSVEVKFSSISVDVLNIRVVAAEVNVSCAVVAAAQAGKQIRANVNLTRLRVSINDNDAECQPLTINELNAETVTNAPASKAPLCLCLSAFTCSASVGVFQANSNQIPVNLIAAVGEIGFHFNVERVSYVCDSVCSVLSRLCPVYSIARYRDGQAPLEPFYRPSFVNFQYVCKASQQALFKHLEDLDTMNTHGHSSVSSFGDLKDAIPTSSSFFDIFELLHLSSEITVDRVVVVADICVLSEMCKLSPRGPKRSLRNPQPWNNSSRQRQRQTLTLLHVSKFSVTVNAPSQSQQIVSISLASIDIGKVWNNSASLQSPDDVRPVAMEIQIELTRSPQEGSQQPSALFTGAIGGHISPLSLNIDLSLLSQSLYYFSQMLSALKASSVPAVYQPTAAKYKDYYSSICSYYFHKLGRSQNLRGKENDIFAAVEKYRQKGYDMASSERLTLIHWVGSTVQIGDISLSISDSNLQFSNCHENLLTAIIRNASMDVVTSVHETGSFADDDGFSDATSDSVVDGITTSVKISVQDISVSNQCNREGDFEPTKPSKFGNCRVSRTGESDQKVVSIAETTITLAWTANRSRNQLTAGRSPLPLHFVQQMDSYASESLIGERDTDNTLLLDLWSGWLAQKERYCRESRSLTSKSIVEMKSLVVSASQFDSTMLSACCAAVAAGASKPSSGFSAFPLKRLASNRLLTDVCAVARSATVCLRSTSLSLRWMDCDQDQQVSDEITISVPGAISVESFSVGSSGLISSSSVAMESDIELHRLTREGASTKLYAACRDRTLFRSIQFPVDIWHSGIYFEEAPSLSRVTPVALIRCASHSYVALGNVAGNLDFNSFDALFKIRGRCAAESTLVSDIVGCCLNHSMWNGYRPIESIIKRNKRAGIEDKNYKVALKSPLSTMLVEIASLSIQFEQFTAPLMDFSTRHFKLATVSFGPNLNQTCGSFDSLKCTDRLLPSAVHQNVFSSINSSASMANKFEFQMSSTTGECSLLEFRGAYLRVVYLQRPVMACVMYFRDYFFPAFGAAFNNEHAAWVAANGYELTPVTCPVPDTFTALGQFRFSIELLNSEAHIPNNARGTDCLTAIFPRLYAFKSAFELSREYCLGPNLTNSTWISDLSHVLNLSRSTMKVNERSNRLRTRLQTTTSTGLEKWNVLENVQLLRAPDTEHRAVKTFKLDVECEKAMLCSWCNRNEIGSNINLKVFLTFEGVPPAPDAMYAPVFESLGYYKHDKNNRNKIVVDISADEVDWTIAQGQYLAIVYLIQQNIPEVQTVVKDVNPPPLNKLVPLEAAAFGRYSLERRVPLFTTVPIHIVAGRLTAVDNEPEYYDLFSRLLFVEENFEATRQELYPLWSNHHVHRAKMFSGCPLEDDEFWNVLRWHQQSLGNSARRQTSPGLTFNDPTLPSQELSTIVRIYFKQLEVDFWKLHYGAGAGIDVAAGSFVITCSKYESNNNAAGSIDSNDELTSHFSTDLENTEPEMIIFGPKTMPQLCKSTTNVVSSPVSDYSPGRDFSFSRRATRVRPGAASRQDADDDHDEEGQVEQPQQPQQPPDEDGDYSWHGDGVKGRGEEGINIGGFVPQLRYRQQGVANLRRCVVDMLDCVLVAHIRPIMAAVSYFVDPISLNNMRGNELLASEGIGPLDFKAGLDVEVHTKSTVIAVPKFSTREGMSVICVQSDLDYVHAFRGFKEAGPARVIISVAVNIYSIFITPIHEIRVTGSESLIDPCVLNVRSVWDLHCPEQCADHNSKILSEHMGMEYMPRKASKTEKAFPVRLISVKMAPIDEFDTDTVASAFRNSLVARRKTSVAAEGDADDDDNNNNDVVDQVLRFKFSLKDVFFVVSAVKQMAKSWQTRRQQKPLRERYLFLFEGPFAFRDIFHLDRPTVGNAYVSLLDTKDDGDQDVVVDSCDLDVILKNNTYNLKIAKVEFKNFSLSYSKAFDRLHMATGLSVAAWTFNENADVWEPIIESTEGSCIAASDTSLSMTSLGGPHNHGSTSSSSSSQIVAVPPVRYDVFCNPVCVNAPESTTVSLIRKFSLADVITTSSIHLPPYRVVNELGLPVTCTLNIGAIQIYESEIAIGNFLPIERRDIAKASYQSNRRAHHRRLAATSIAASADNDHKLGLVFELDGDSYNSKEPLPIDREGIFAYDMKCNILSGRQKRRSTGFDMFGTSSALNEEEASSQENRALSEDLVVAGQSSFNTIKTHGGGTMTFNKQLVPSAASLRNAKASSHNRNLPYSLVSMRMKDDGGRELVLRSVLSLKNLSNWLIYVSIRRGPITVETSIAPGVEWNVPIQVAHPKSSLLIKRSEKSPWCPILATLGSLILQGLWGAPTKLKAEICCCPANHEQSTGSVESDWLLMLRPEVRDTKGGSISAQGSRTFIPVRYPAKDTSKNRQAQLAAELAVANNGGETTAEGIFGFNDLYNASFSNSNQFRSIVAQPMCFQFIAPLQLCNLLSQPLLYRVADNDGLIVCEGTLLPGEVIDLHSVYQLFAKRIFLSIRLLNYCWSKWTKILSKNNPFPSTEKIIEIALNSMNLFHQGCDLLLPNVDVVCAMRENLVRISCPIIIRNCTGLQLDIAESGSLDAFTPHSSQPPVETVVAMKLRNVSAAADAELALIPTAAAAPSHPVAVGANDNTLSLQYPGELAAAVPVTGNEVSAGTAIASAVGDDGVFEGAYFSSSDSALTRETFATFATHTPTPTPDSQDFPGGSTPQNIVPTFRTGASGGGTKATQTITLVIHMPFDHFSKIEVVAAPDWTLSSVFAKIMPRLAVNKVHRSHYSYVFVPWEDGANGPGTVPHSPAVEANLFGPSRNSVAASASSTASNSSNNVNSNNNPSGTSRASSRMVAPPVKDDDDDDDDEEETSTAPLQQDTKQAELLSAHIAHKKGDNHRTSFFSRRSITGMFNSSSSASSSTSVSSLTGRPSVAAHHPHITSGIANAPDNEVGIPPSMAFGMIADFSSESISMETRVDQLTCLRLRLCHMTEHRMFEQVQNIKTETVATEGIITIFKGSKVRRRTVFEKIEGDLPFNPRKSSILGFSTSLCLRVAHLTGWSNPLELHSANFGSGSDYVAVHSMQYSTNRMQDVHFEFGAYAERGKGFYQNILCVTIVPKHILVFKLRVPMQVRQLGDHESSRLTTLKPGSIQNYHYPVIKKDKYLQLRRGDTAANKAAAKPPEPDGTRFAWYGEIDITRLGIVYVKLRDPLFIVKIQVEVVGASLIATIAPQDKQWPPYRIDNQTTLVCRYRQIMSLSAVTASTASMVPASQQPFSASSTVTKDGSNKAVKFADNNSYFNSDFNQDGGGGQGRIPWDELKPGESSPYAWDQPITGEKLIRLEFTQGPTWAGFDVSLDDVSKPRILSLLRPLVGLSNPQAEGSLRYRDASTDTFIPVYCILKADVIYVFRDASRNELLEVVCLAKSSCIGLPVGPDNDLRPGRKDSIKLSSVFRYVDHGSWTSSFLGGTSKSQSNIDMNKARILLLMLADGLGVFKTVPKGCKASKDQARERAASFSSDSSAGDTSDGNSSVSSGSVGSSKGGVNKQGIIAGNVRPTLGAGAGGVAASSRELEAAPPTTAKPLAAHSEPTAPSLDDSLPSDAVEQVNNDGVEGEENTNASGSQDEQAEEEEDGVIPEPQTEEAVEALRIVKQQSFHATHRGALLGSPTELDVMDDCSAFGSDDESVESIRSQTAKADTGSCLREQLQLGVPVDQLLEYISAFTFEVFDIVDALVAIEEASSEEAAKNFVYQLVAQGILTISSADEINDMNNSTHNNRNNSTASASNNVNNNTTVSQTPSSRSESNNVSTASSNDNLNKLSTSTTNSALSNADLNSLLSKSLTSSLGAQPQEPLPPAAKRKLQQSRDGHVVYDGRDSDEDEAEADDEREDVDDEEDDAENQEKIKEFLEAKHAITSRASMTVTGLDLKELRQITPAEILANALTMTTKLTFGLPSLFPELAALATANADVLQNAKERMTILGGQDENEVNGFTIFRADGAPVHFQCGSEHEFLGWIQGCRQNIEQVWCKFVSSLPLKANRHHDNEYEETKRSDCFITEIDGHAAALGFDVLAPMGYVTGNISADSFKLRLNLKVRADGPTKVLEMTEADPIVDNKILSVVAKSTGNNRIHEIDDDSDDDGDTDKADEKEKGDNDNDQGQQQQQEEANTTDDSSKPKATTPPPSPSLTKKASVPKTPAELQALREQQYALFVSVKVESVSVSLIDAEPAEVIFLNLRDIRLSVERTYQRLTIAATVQDLQVSNQLLNPSFPVALHPRRFLAAAVAAAGGGPNTQARLMLPGLHHIDDDEFPALHLFVQQKLYHNDKSVAGLITSNGGVVGDSSGSGTKGSIAINDSAIAQQQAAGADAVINTKESKLMYFEMATVWLAPMELNIDEELVVRLMRFTNMVRSSLRKPDMGSLNRLHEEILSIQHHGNKSWGTMDALTIATGFTALLDACKSPYMDFTPLGRVSVFLYFSLLQLHPLDIVMNLHSSPSFPITTSEMTIVTLLSQIDGARLCLNALVTEHAFGSQSIIMDIIIKHYKASLWRQFHKLIGSADIVEGSVGLVANLGSGVYDLFYEPIEGLLDENGSFLNGLSKGGRSLASRTIGGTSGFTSKITGGIGKGVSFLTMDRDFYRNRASRRLNKTTSVSEGLYVGGKELGKNIVEGFSGIVVSPYRGYEEGGAVGFGMGIAKGILGVALKPAVGVFDLASRATEGIRHTAFGADGGGGGPGGPPKKKVVVRSRIPRAFGRSNVLLPYNLEASAAQFLVDKLINFNRDTRVIIVHHQHFIRALAPSTATYEDTDKQRHDSNASDDSAAPAIATLVPSSTLSTAADTPAGASAVAVAVADQEAASATESSGESVLGQDSSNNSNNNTLLADMSSKVRNEAMNKLIASSNASRLGAGGAPLGRHASVLMYKDEGQGDFQNPQEAWGMAVGHSYVALISAYRISLVEVRSTRESPKADFRFIWSCPASCMDQLYSDSRGDLILSVGTTVGITGPWNSPYPVVLDFFAQNFMILQSLLEQTIGPRLARLQQLAPSGGLIQKDLYKRYSSGLKSILLSPTKQTFQLHGYVLYEYTTTTSSSAASKKAAANAAKEGDGSGAGAGSGVAGAGAGAGEGGAAGTGGGGGAELDKKDKKPDDSITTLVGHIFARPVPPVAAKKAESSQPSSPVKSPRRSSVSAGGIADTDSGSGGGYITTGTPEGVLTYVYPLVDIVLLGPYKEDNGKYSLSLSRKDGARMRVLKRESADDLLFEHHKSMLTIVFPDSKSAWKWRHSIESHIVRSPAISGDVIIPSTAGAPLIPDKRKTILGSITGAAMSSSSNSSNAAAGVGAAGAGGPSAAVLNTEEPLPNSILGCLVIPSSGMPASVVETMKVEIAKTLLLTRR